VAMCVTDLKIWRTWVNLNFSSQNGESHLQGGEYFFLSVLMRVNEMDKETKRWMALFHNTHYRDGSINDHFNRSINTQC